MLLPKRHASDESYRYGFQGQEKDDELKGEGNSVNYKYRMHDPRIGRFFAIDPLAPKYPHYTPYQFSGNKVIQFIELEGLEEALIDNHIKRRAYKTVFAEGEGLTTGDRIANALDNSIPIALYNLYANANNTFNSVINTSYWLITGQKSYDLHNDVIAPSQKFFNDEWHNKSYGEVANDTKNAFVKTFTSPETMEDAWSFAIPFKFSRGNRLSRGSSKTQGLAAATEKTVESTTIKQPIILTTFINKPLN